MPQSGPNSSVDGNLICYHESSLVQQHSACIFCFSVCWQIESKTTFFLNFDQGARVSERIMMGLHEHKSHNVPLWLLMNTIVKKELDC